HLERGGLSRPVRAQKSHALSGADLEGDAVDRAHDGISSAEDGGQGGKESGPAAVHPVVFDQVADGEHGGVGVCLKTVGASPGAKEDEGEEGGASEAGERMGRGGSGSGYPT